MAINIQNTTYYTAVATDTFNVSMKDDQGNTFRSVVIQADTTAGDQTFVLPELSTISDETELIIVVKQDTNDITITPASGDFIGSASTYAIASGGGDFANYVLTPVDAKSWSLLKTA
jgi:hypothetical protein